MGYPPDGGNGCSSPDNQIIGQVVEEDVGFGPENMGVPAQRKYGNGWRKA